MVEGIYANDINSTKKKNNKFDNLYKTFNKQINIIVRYNKA